MNDKVKTTAEPPAMAELKARKRYKGRPVYTQKDRDDPKFRFPYPPEPEWEEEWHKRRPNQAAR